MSDHHDNSSEVPTCPECDSKIHGQWAGEWGLWFHPDCYESLNIRQKNEYRNAA